jgi:hypothetical protein
LVEECIRLEFGGWGLGLGAVVGVGVGVHFPLKMHAKFFRLLAQFYKFVTQRCAKGTQALDDVAATSFWVTIARL